MYEHSLPPFSPPPSTCTYQAPDALKDVTEDEEFLEAQAQLIVFRNKPAASATLTAAHAFKHTISYAMQNTIINEREKHDDELNQTCDLLETPLPLSRSPGVGCGCPVNCQL